MANTVKQYELHVITKAKKVRGTHPYIRFQVSVDIEYNYTKPDPLSPREINCNEGKWRHNDHAGVSNHQPHGCLLDRLLRRKSKKTSKFRVTGLCAGNSPGTGEFPAQMASYAENVSIWWRHHDIGDFMWDVTTHPCPNFNDGLIKPPMELGHGWIITYYRFIWM